MEWGKVWRTVFCGWDGEVDFARLAAASTSGADRAAALEATTPAVDEREAARWVCRRIQGSY